MRLWVRVGVVVRGRELADLPGSLARTVRRAVGPEQRTAADFVAQIRAPAALQPEEAAVTAPSMGVSVSPAGAALAGAPPEPTAAVTEPIENP